MSRHVLRALSTTLVTLAVLPLTAQAVEPTQVEITTPRVSWPDSATLRAMTGDFALSDGRSLRVLRPGLHLMVAIGRGWARTVEPVGERQFATADGRLVLAFDPGLDTLRVIEQSSVAVATRSSGTTLR